MTRSTLPAVRAALEEFLAGEQYARLARMRDPDEDAAPASRARGRWLMSSAGQDAMSEAREQGELHPAEALWLERHLALVPYRLAMLSAHAELRATLAAAHLASGEPLELAASVARLAHADAETARAASAREVERALRPIARNHVAACARAEESLLVRRAVAARGAGAAEPARAPGSLLIVSAFSPEGMAEQAPRELPDEPLLAAATSFLSHTQAAAEDAVERCVHKLGAKLPLPWHALLRGLRAPELDSESGAKLRWRRAAAFLRVLGFEDDLSARMRGEVDRGGVLPLATALPLALPRDVRVAQLANDFGVASDVFAAEGVGRALGLALVHGALPPELRWPAGASTSGALGGLALQLWSDRGHLTRVQGLASAAADRVGQIAGLLALLHARFWAAASTAQLADAGRPEARQQALAEALGRALCCDLPEGVAGLLCADRVTARARACEALAGFALHAGLRERFDADWFRNPRSEEVLRYVCASGNRLTPEDACAELRTSFDHAAARATELVA